MPEMTCEERMLCALNREEPDRVPLYDLLDNVQVYEHYAGQKLTLQNAAEVVPLAISRALDHTRIWLPSAPGKWVDERGFTHERVDWWNEWQVDTPFHDLVGAKAFVQAEVERLEAASPANDVEAHLADLLHWKEKYRGTVIPANTAGEALADAWILLGLDYFVYLQSEEPALTQRWLDAIHAHTMRRLQSAGRLRAVSPVVWLFADLAFKGRLIFSPAYMREHGVFRRMAEICALYHSFGFKVIFHSDGYIRPMIPDLIAAGVDALAPIETGSGLDLGDLKAEFGGQVALCGGLDVGQVLRFGSVDDVRRATLRALDAAGRGGGLILGSSSEELFESLPAENIIAMWETTRECGRYPIGQYFPRNFEWR